MSRTPEEMAEEYVTVLEAIPLMHYLPTEPCRKAYLAGYRSRDEEVEQLKEEIAMLKADLREGFRDE
jgi:hypothetical protein